MLLPEILPHIGRYCEVVTRGGKLFGEFGRLSAVLFVVRSSWPASRAVSTVQAAEIEAILDLENPHS